jgi:pimeloyl-ACP methyl ester carboxylesterase
MTLHTIDRIAVEDEGDGDAVVCVHGLGGSSNTFNPLMATLARHRVIRVDMPGSARSARVEGALSIARFVDALQSVCARLGVDRAHWIGHSLGTIVCQHLAVAAPKLVRSRAARSAPVARRRAAKASPACTRSRSGSSTLRSLPTPGSARRSRSRSCARA